MVDEAAARAVEVWVPSAVLGEDVLVLMLPGRRAIADLPSRWVWLLHGRGGRALDAAPLLDAMARAVSSGLLPPTVIAAVDAPWSRRASWWVDSSYTGSALLPRGRPVETAVLQEVLPEIERRFGPPPGRAARSVAGISMGGAAALRWATVHAHLFSSALLLAPAVYDTPPPASSAHSSGAFGNGRVVYEEQVWAATMSRTGLLARRPLEELSTTIVTIVGDQEPTQQDADGDPADLTLEAGRLHAALRRRPGTRSELRVISGGHDQRTWERSFVRGLQLLHSASPLAAPP